MEQMNNEQQIYNAALYCRLSKDDEQAGESVSIGTQKMILEKFCKEHDFRIYDVYVDDGFSGLNFERPEFQRMLKDVEDGKINLVITKDLSRLGRDYIQTGYYTEVYFLQKHVRYIAVNDGIDTNREDNDIAPFKNILNDMYAKDLSRKVKVAKRQRAYKGLFISAQTPYGYKVDPADKNHLVVDEEASDVVKEIFRLALSGKSLVQISRILTENQILTPGSYKAIKGDTRFERYLKDGKYSFSWCYQTVSAILKDRVYVGDIVNHRYEISNYKTKERISIPAEKHIVVAGRHEAIVSREDFERVQQLIRLRHRPKKHEFRNIFQKLTFCAECGHHMTMMMKPLKGGTYPLIRCTNHFQNPEECTHHHQIYYEELYTEILKSVQGIAKQIESGELLKGIQKQKKSQKNLVKLEQEKNKIQKRLISLKKIIRKLYEDFAEDLLDSESYHEMLSEYTQEQKRLSAKLSVIDVELNSQEDYEKRVEKLKSILDEYLTIEELTETMVNQLIEKIEIGHSQKVNGVRQQEITIVYRFVGKVED